MAVQHHGDTTEENNIASPNLMISCYRTSDFQLYQLLLSRQGEEKSASTLFDDVLNSQAAVTGCR